MRFQLLGITVAAMPSRQVGLTQCLQEELDRQQAAEVNLQTQVCPLAPPVYIRHTVCVQL